MKWGYCAAKGRAKETDEWFVAVGVPCSQCYSATVQGLQNPSFRISTPSGMESHMQGSTSELPSNYLVDAVNSPPGRFANPAFHQLIIPSSQITSEPIG